MASREVYAEYCRWCREQGEKPESITALSLAIKKTFHVEPTLKKSLGRGFDGLNVQTANGM